MPENIAVIVAHADDEVLGCGGTIARAAHNGDSVHVLVLADGVSSRQELPGAFNSDYAARNEAAEMARTILGYTTLKVHSFPDNRMDSVALLDVVKLIERHLAEYQISTLFTHHNGDVNIDHRIVHDAVVAATRPQPHCKVRKLLLFETLSSTEWRPPASGIQFSPNYFIDISDTLDLKLKALEAYVDELRDFPHSRSLAAVKALARYRGVSAGLLAAEAFVLARSILKGQSK